MSYFFIKKNSYRILSFLCAVIVLFFSPCSKYLDASSIDHVYASDWAIAGGAAGVDAFIKAMIAIFGSAAAGEAYSKHKEEVNQSFYDYISAPSNAGDIIFETSKDTCIKIYDKAANTMREIPWDAFMESLAEGHDSVVDDLTDLYVQFCPALLGSIEDFVSAVFSGEVDIPGFSLELMDDTFSDYESIQNVDGSYNVVGYSYFANTDYNSPNSFYYSDTVDFRPFCLVLNTNEYLFYVYTGDGTVHNEKVVNISYKQYIKGVFIGESKKNSIGGNNYDITSVNIPVFALTNDAHNAFALDDFSSALNYADTMESVIDLTKVPDLAPDIPPFTKAWQQKQWGEASDVIDFGGLAEGDYAGDDLPFWGLSDLDEFAGSIQDIFDKALEGIFEGTDVIEYPTTYDDVWDDSFADAWDKVKDGALDIPVDDDGNPAVPRPYPWDGDIPANPDIPSNPDIPADPDIDVPADSVVDIPIEDIVPSVNDSFIDVAGSLRYKFPFSIPWDIQYMLSCLAETPKAPRFELPIVIERYGIDEKIIIEMSMFQTLSDLSRSLFSMLFAIFLVNLTFKVVGMRKEE